MKKVIKRQSVWKVETLKLPVFRITNSNNRQDGLRCFQKAGTSFKSFKKDSFYG